MSVPDFLLHCPLAETKIGSTYQMTLPELASLPVPTNIDSIKSLFSITLLGFATWYRNKSTVLDFRRDQVRLAMRTKAPVKGVYFIRADLFVKLFPSAVSGPGSTYQLSPVQIETLQTKYLKV